MSDEELIKETMMLDYSQLVMNNVYCHKEIKRLHSIIKEVREYLDNMEEEKPELDYQIGMNTIIVNVREILDKENKE